MSDSARSPYEGKSRRLVVSIDVGTTFTAASFCILHPGKSPKFEEVLRWPKQAIPDAKVPSVIYYDEDGTPKAFGAETDDDETIMEAELGPWSKCEWWKLHLRPSHLPLIRDLSLPPLPKGVSAQDIFADFLRYIRRQLEEYITSQYGEGGNIWTSLFPTMYVILTTPNGWEGAQQNRMRQAAVQAGLVDPDGGRRVRFVTEAEAAVLYAVDSGCIGDWLVEDGNLILCDCGGGTIDITGYNIKAVKPLQLEETAASRCYLAGAVFVTQAAKDYLKLVLKKTEWDNEEALQRAVQHFDRNAKRKFSNPEESSWVELGGFKSFPKLGIVRGRLKIPGTEMAKFFEPSLKAIREGLEIAFENGERLADKVILVGGLVSSAYVYKQLCKWGEDNAISVSRPDGPTSKAVANGALAWHVDRSVAARVSKFHYGIRVAVRYDPANKEMEGRATYPDETGVVRVDGAWSSILDKGVRVAADKEFFGDYSITFALDATDLACSTDVYVYRRLTPPLFIHFRGKTTTQPGFEVICKITAKLTDQFAAAKAMTSPEGKKYKNVAIQVCMSLGETELTARLRWKVEGEYVYGPATIAYD